MITSKSNSQYKRIKRLLSSAKARREEGLFVVEGERIVSEAPPSLIDTLCVSASFAKEKEFSSPAIVFSDEVFRALSDTVNPQGIMAVVKQPESSPDEIISSPGSLFLILDDIRDPGNLGTMIRTAEAAGVCGVIMSKGCADIFSPKVIRSTMGSIFRVPFASADLILAIGLLKKAGAEIYGASLEGSIYYDEIVCGEKSAVIIGNEARGICPEVLACADKKIKIPMAGEVESLNAAVSCAVILYGLKRKG